MFTFSSPSSFCQTNKAPRFPSELHFSDFSSEEKKTIINLAAERLGAPAFPPSAGVYGIRYAWNTFHLTEGFSHVFPTVTKVCGFKQILRACVSLCADACVSQDNPPLTLNTLLKPAVESQAPKRWGKAEKKLGGRWETKINKIK